MLFVLLFVGLSIYWSRPVCYQSYIFVGLLIHQSRQLFCQSEVLQNSRYTSHNHCINIPHCIKSRTNEALLLPTVSAVLLFSRTTVCRTKNGFQDYRHECRAIDTLSRTIGLQDFNMQEYRYARVFQLTTSMENNGQCIYG